MKELWLKYIDENGVPKRVSVRGEKFFIGRSPENDLSIPISQLSRRHAEIDRYEDAYVISDNYSSNGTTINGESLYRPTALENGDRINLGGGVEIEVELVSWFPEQAKSPAQSEDSKSSALAVGAAANSSMDISSADFANQPVIAPQISENNSAPEPPAPVVPAVKPESSGLSSFFIIAPVLAIVILLLAGGLLWILSGSKDDVALNTKKSSYDYSGDDDDKPNKNKKSENTNENLASTPITSGSVSTNSSSTPESKETQIVSNSSISSDTNKIEKNAYPFLRKIAKADSNPVLTSKQIEIVNAKIKSFKGSSALQGNLQDLKKKTAEIEALARSKSLKPQFLAAAALAQIGNKRGDVLATAQSMAGDLNQLSNSIANDLSSESLMIIAIYQADPTGAKSGMRSKLANLTIKYPNESAQNIRTIWFLYDKGQITREQFDFALQFLAIGIITQNPKDFGVEAEPVVFN